ncbi:hypothetical protein Tco_0631643, partial [Tanacetum coccineum]
QEKVHHGADVGAVIMKTGVPGQEGAKATVTGKAVTTATTITGSMHQVCWLKQREIYCFGDQQEDAEWPYTRVSQSRFNNEKFVQIFVRRGTPHFGSQEYQVVCTRPDIASAGVDMLDGFDRGLQTNVQVFVDFDYTMGISITSMIDQSRVQVDDTGNLGRRRYGKWTLLIESGYELRLIAGIATDVLVKGCFRSSFQATWSIVVAVSVWIYSDTKWKMLDIVFTDIPIALGGLD